MQIELAPDGPEIGMERGVVRRQIDGCRGLFLSIMHRAHLQD